MASLVTPQTLPHVGNDKSLAEAGVAGAKVIQSEPDTKLLDLAHLAVRVTCGRRVEDRWIRPIIDPRFDEFSKLTAERLFDEIRASRRINGLVDGPGA